MLTPRAAHAPAQLRVLRSESMLLWHRGAAAWQSAEDADLSCCQVAKQAAALAMARPGWRQLLGREGESALHLVDLQRDMSCSYDLAKMLSC